MIDGQKLHGAHQGSEMIGSKITVQQMPLLPMLFEYDTVFILFALQQSTIYATVFLAGLLDNHLAGVYQFFPFSLMRVDGNF